MNSPAENAATARARAGFKTHEAAAKAIGCSRTLVLAWEKGDAAIKDSKFLLNAARAYRVRPRWLAEGEGSDGYPWSDSDAPHPAAAEPLIPALPDDLPLLVQALSYSQALLAQALASTIPTAGRELLSALDMKLPAELREIGHIQVLRKTILQQLASDDMAALPAPTEKAPGAPRRKRR